MASRVAGEQYETITGQLFELGRQLRQPNGYPFDPVALKRHLQAAIEGRFFKDGNTPVFSRDMTKEGWILEGDVAEPLELSIGDSEVVSFFKEGESSVSGNEMVERAKTLSANLGQKHAEHLLEHQDEIPEEWRSHYLIFPGTVWRDPGGDRFVLCLSWRGERWGLGFGWLGVHWGSVGRLVRSRK